MTKNSTDQISGDIAQNIARVREQTEAAALRAGRARDSVRLMGVTKTHPATAIRDAHAAGLRLFGENRVQEFATKASVVSDLKDAEFHLIGHLQSNKAAKAATLFQAVDSVDSLKLAEKLDDAASRAGRIVNVLIEINVGGEQAKSGVLPASKELDQLLRDTERLKSLRFRGLMTIPPHTDDPEGARPYFRKLREMRDEIAARKLPGVEMEELSMGMSHDFAVAIAEGSTCVRLGTAIFGARPPIAKDS